MMQDRERETGKEARKLTRGHTLQDQVRPLLGLQLSSERSGKPAAEELVAEGRPELKQPPLKRTLGENSSGVKDRHTELGPQPRGDLECSLNQFCPGRVRCESPLDIQIEHHTGSWL